MISSIQIWVYLLIILTMFVLINSMLLFGTRLVLTVSNVKCFQLKHFVHYSNRSKNLAFRKATELVPRLVRDLKKSGSQQKYVSRQTRLVVNHLFTHTHTHTRMKLNIIIIQNELNYSNTCSLFIMKLENRLRKDI